jgi:hypothetical protein
VVYAALPDLLTELRNLPWFALPLEQQLALGNKQVEVWLAHTEQLVKKGLAEAAEAIKAGHRDIRTYFPQRPTLNPQPG